MYIYYDAIIYDCFFFFSFFIRINIIRSMDQYIYIQRILLIEIFVNVELTVRKSLDNFSDTKFDGMRLLYMYKN